MRPWTTTVAPRHHRLLANLGVRWKSGGSRIICRNRRSQRFEDADAAAMSAFGARTPFNDPVYPL